MSDPLQEMIKRISGLESQIEKLSRADNGHDYPTFMRGRLTLESGVPVSLSDQTAKSRIYFTPYFGCYGFSEIYIDLAQTQNGTIVNLSAIITGLTDTYQLCVGMSVTGANIPGGATILSIDSTTQITMSANATAGATEAITFTMPASSVFDVIYHNNRLSLVKWSTISARVTALLRSQGFLSLNLASGGGYPYRYIGSGFTGSVAGQMQVSQTNGVCGLWNMYNKVKIPIFCAESTAHTDTTAGWRTWNNSGGVLGADRLGFCVGWLEDNEITVNLYPYLGNVSATETGYIGIGLNSASTPNIGGVTYRNYMQWSQGIVGTVGDHVTTIYTDRHIALGYNYIQVIEYGATPSADYILHQTQAFVKS
jgi:hypothetical protein